MHVQKTVFLLAYVLSIVVEGSPKHQGLSQIVGNKQSVYADEIFLL